MGALRYTATVGIALTLGLIFASIGGAKASIATDAPLGGEVTVTLTGHVGQLQIDRSAHADIRRLAGKPQHVVVGRFYGGFPKYEALAYDCSRRAVKRPNANGLASIGSDLVSHVSCRTIYFVNLRTRRFAAFWTTSSRFRTPSGTRPGMDGNKSDHLEGSGPNGGPWSGLTRSTKTAQMLIENNTCKYNTQLHPHSCVGGTVDALVLGSRGQDIGILFE